jgi:hypothetical protein
MQVTLSHAFVDSLSASIAFIEANETAFKIVLGFLGAIGALVVFHRDHSTKAAELLLKLEDRFHELHDIVLEIEYLQEYESRLAPALRELDRQGSFESRAIKLTKESSEAINDLERLLRHLYTCSQLRRMWINRRSIDSFYAYYLGLLLQRPEIKSYMQRYWRQVHLWAELTGANAFSRVRVHGQLITPQLIGGHGAI